LPSGSSTTPLTATVSSFGDWGFAASKLEPFAEAGLDALVTTADCVPDWLAGAAGFATDLIPGFVTPDCFLTAPSAARTNDSEGGDTSTEELRITATDQRLADKAPSRRREFIRGLEYSFIVIAPDFHSVSK
jgi:hypothetical protein